MLQSKGCCPVSRRNSFDIVKPSHLHLTTTSCCNLKCEHCYLEASPSNSHYSLEIINKILDESKKNKISNITLTGGELLTRPDWKDIINKAMDACDSITIISNGLLLSEQNLTWLVHRRIWKMARNFFENFKWKPFNIKLAVSLDGLKGNGLVRKDCMGNGVNSDDVLEKIKLVTQYGLETIVNTTITNSVSAKELPELYNILSNLNIDRWMIDTAFIAGRLTNSSVCDKNFTFGNDLKKSYRYIIGQYLEDYKCRNTKWDLSISNVFQSKYLMRGFDHIDTVKCHPCKDLGNIVVDDGNLLRFCFALRTLEIGRLENGETFENLVNSNKDLESFLQGTIENLPCKDCRYAKVFHGGCRANSYSYRGKIWDIDPICCMLAPFVEDEIVSLLPLKLQEQFRLALQPGSRGMIKNK